MTPAESGWHAVRTSGGVPYLVAIAIGVVVLLVVLYWLEGRDASDMWDDEEMWK